MTVSFLVDVDKLVQLLESPIFACKRDLSATFLHQASFPTISLFLFSTRSPLAALGTRKPPIPLQMPLRDPDALAPKRGLHHSADASKQRLIHGNPQPDAQGEAQDPAAFPS